MRGFGSNREASGMNDDTRRRDKRFAVKTWHLILAILAVLIVLVGLYAVIRKGSVNRQLEALRAAGYPTSLAELADYSKLPEGTANAAEVYLRAFATFVRPVDDVNIPYLGAAPSPDRGKPLAEPMVKAIAQCLASNQQCLSLLHEAGGIPDCDYDWDGRMYTAGTSQWGDLKHCAQLLVLEALYSAHAGDPNATIQCIEDGLRLADSLSRESVLIGYLVRVACISVALGGLERSLSLTAYTDAQLRELGDALTATADSLDFTQAMIAERCLMIEMCRNPALAAGGSGAGGTPPRFLGRWGLDDVLDYMGKCVDASRLPPGQRLARFRAIEKEVEDLSFLHVMIKMTAPAMSRVAALDLRMRAHLDLTRTALAVERYRLATGKLPEALNALVPQYLAQVPIDPFDGQALRYRRTDPGYLLYDVGEDGQDNGGLERDQTNRGAPYDWCFIVTR